MPATYFYNMVRYLDTNWIQRRDDVLNLPSLLDFSFARAVQIPSRYLREVQKPCKIVCSGLFAFPR